MKLTEAERKLKIAVVALRYIANPDIRTYSKVVDRQIEIAKKALDSIVDGGSDEAI
jgi:hypothetical protein